MMHNDAYILQSSLDERFWSLQRLIFVGQQEIPDPGISPTHQNTAKWTHKNS
jgi:hypothetical protein